MAIVGIPMFTVQCDNCTVKYEDKHSGICAWNDTLYLLEEAGESGWNHSGIKDKEGNFLHLCPDCWEHDDEDNVVVKPLKDK